MPVLVARARVGNWKFTVHHAGGANGIGKEIALAFSKHG
jgi:hypothetical protein